MTTASLDILRSLPLPMIAAPMTGVSSPALVVAACAEGVVGSFPTHNAGSVDELDDWLSGMSDRLVGVPGAAPVAPNLVVHPSNRRLEADLACLRRHQVRVVITSVGSPAAVVPALHEAGCAVLADVATLRQAHRAAQAGVDGLVLLTAGAGGQTGHANPFAFVRAVREFFDGVVVLAGGIADGRALWAAQVLGADLGYVGTPFIATCESVASDDYRAALVAATLDDVRLSDAVSGLPASILAQWLDARADAPVTAGDFQEERLVANPDVWSAGHAVTQVREVSSVAEVVARIRAGYQAARGLVELAR
ncbi:NAD(P)H-dependent flavin oxidoreductase [Nocardioides daeguensis]|uniref:Nitronate monooxygenase n=2 Tax=Nocardioides daeguensis TaxID=908359 RepID=A0ABP6UY47_9ACTN|nr:nitronate monooxygenase [Nocardioides daeguensis]MBV6728773.1 nitronate monooxygenase [Nocardioides daeguensis]MCR1773617.1 nitronate monooxygenase [Nocardioides daeguensis]